MIFNSSSFKCQYLSPYYQTGKALHILEEKKTKLTDVLLALLTCFICNLLDHGLVDDIINHISLNKEDFFIKKIIL